MKLYFYDKQGKVTESVTVSNNADLSRAVFAEYAPTYSPGDGEIGHLYCYNGKLVWHYSPIDPNKELSAEQLDRMMKGVI